MMENTFEVGSGMIRYLTYQVPGFLKMYFNLINVLSDEKDYITV